MQKSWKQFNLYKTFHVHYLCLTPQVIPANPTGRRQEGAESEEPRQQRVGQQVFLALADGREVKSSAELVEVNMYDLLNNSVAFICEDKPAGCDS